LIKKNYTIFPQIVSHYDPVRAVDIIEQPVCLKLARAQNACDYDQSLMNTENVETNPLSGIWSENEIEASH
jgi:hypothetical protein